MLPVPYSPHRRPNSDQGQHQATPDCGEPFLHSPDFEQDHPKMNVAPDGTIILGHRSFKIIDH